MSADLPPTLVATACPGRSDGGGHSIPDGKSRCQRCGRDGTAAPPRALRDRIAATNTENGKVPRTALQNAQNLLVQLLEEGVPVPSRATLIHEQKRFVAYLAHREVELRALEDTVAQRDMDLAVMRKNLEMKDAHVEKLQGDIRDMAEDLKDQKLKERTSTRTYVLPEASTLPTYGPASLLAVKCVSEDKLRVTFAKWDDGGGMVTVFQCLDVCIASGVAATLPAVDSICKRFALGPRLTLEEVHLVAMKVLNP